jgi:hypothetical protein
MSTTATHEGTGAEGAEGRIPEPETGSGARGGVEGDTGTPQAGTGQANAGNGGQGKKPEPAKAFGFTAQMATPFVPLKLGFPALWPETSVKPIFFKLDYLLSGDADREQMNFLQMTEDEQAAETYRYDCRMLGLLSCLPPEGLLDFPEVRADFDPDDAEHRKELAASVFAYLYRPEAENRRAFEFIARQFMSRYWARVNPRDYL